MPVQIVATLFATEITPTDDARDAEAFVERLAAVSQRARAHGGKLCALSAQTAAFAFHSGDLEEAVTFATHAVRPGDFAAAIVSGDFAPLFSSGAFVDVAWGPCLLDGEAIARATAAGSVVALRGVPGIEVYETASAAVTISVEGRSFAVVELDGSAELPQNLRDAGSLPPPPPTGPVLAERYLDLARQALVRGDIESLDKALENLKPTGAHSGVVERLQGILAVTRGEKLEGLRKLRLAADGETRPEMKTRARLAYAVALGAAGRAEPALLEGLLALASAREVDDHQGAKACARFLSQLSIAAGHKNAAEKWQALVVASDASRA